MVGGWAVEEGGSDLDTNVIQGRKHEHESFIVGCGIKTFIQKIFVVTGPILGPQKMALQRWSLYEGRGTK